MTAKLPLSNRFHICDQSLSVRREFIGLGPDDIETLKGLTQWARDNAAEIATAFYDQQFSFPATREFFEDQAKRKGMTMDALRTYLEAAQKGYLISVFEGASTGYGGEYAESRLHVGKLHDEIGLPCKWYIGSYAIYQALVSERLSQIKKIKPATRARAEQAVFRVFNYDMQLVTDSYMLTAFESFGLKLESINVGGERDLSECVKLIEAEVSQLINTIANSVGTLTASSNDLIRSSEELEQSASIVASSTEELTASISEISIATTETAGITQEAVTASEQAQSAIGELDEASDQIGAVTQLIVNIAAQTNLLALNATIEAARAGDLGKGFAVVAGEVKSLASETTGATEDIEQKIAAIQQSTSQAGKTIAGVGKVVQEVSMRGTSVAAAVEEQTAVVSEMSKSAGTSAGLARNAREAALQLQQLAAELEAVTQRFDLKS